MRQLATLINSSITVSPPMATATVFSVLVLVVVVVLPSSSAASPYLSPTTLRKDYRNMLNSFKIFIYTPSKPFDFPTSPASLLYNSLLLSTFRTTDPAQAHLFFVPFSADTSNRSLARLVRELRNAHPYWNRTLGADHFFISPAGIDYSSDRNLLELKKNSIQISLFPVVSGLFIPHKDITLPPLNRSPLTLPEGNSTGTSFLGYLRWDGHAEPSLVNELRSHADFLVEEKPGPVDRSRFCLFLYNGEMSRIAEAMASGCVPVVIVDRPIQDLPLMDVLRWSDLALLVAARAGGERLKQVLNEVSEDKYGEMRERAVAASRHLMWNDEPQPWDAFHMVVYQLWRRHHVIRYARRDEFV